MLRSTVRPLALVACLAIALQLISGCTQKPAAGPTKAPPAKVPPSEPTPASEPVVAVEDEAPSSQAQNPSATADPAPAQLAVDPEASAKDDASTERIVIFSPGAPVIVELRLSIDGQPHTHALERLVDEVLELADADGDGRTTWQELGECKRVKYGQYGNLAIDGENGLKQVIDLYDIARDDIVSRQELPRFLTRNAGGSRPFSVRGMLSYRDRNRRGSPTWNILDADDDGRLSADECASSRVRLASRDADDDEIIAPADLVARVQLPGMRTMTERRRGPEAARLLGPHADWSAVQQALEQEYGGGRFLRVGAFPASPELFAALDKNNDGRLSKDEYPFLNEAPPQLALAVEFGAQAGAAEADTVSKIPRLTLIEYEPQYVNDSRTTAEHANGVHSTLFGTVFEFFANDTVAAADFTARAAQVLAMFDQNKNGYVEPDELPDSLAPQLARFEAIDADEDGKVFPQEIEAYLSQQQAGLRAQIHARVSDAEDAIFVALDADRDGRLTGRELEQASIRLAAFDHDQDGFVIPSEIPDALEIAIARGSIETPDATFARPGLAGPQASDDLPRWFTSMDANRDGVISRREFLGSGEQFKQLDQNESGLIDAVESKTAQEQATAATSP